MHWVRVREALTGAFNAQLLERTPDSGTWPCDYGGAQTIRARLPTTKPYREPSPPHKPLHEHSAGVRVAEAVLQTHEIQELGDQIGVLRDLAEGYALNVHVRIELGGAPSDEVVAKVNAVLAKIAKQLRMR